MASQPSVQKIQQLREILTDLTEAQAITLLKVEYLID